MNDMYNGFDIAGIMNYVRSKYTVTADVQRILQHELIRLSGCSLYRRIVRDTLEIIGMDSREITAIVEGKVPHEEKLAIPVYARYNLGVRVWVEVPESATDNEIKQAAIEKILLEGDYEADEGLDQEAEDIDIYEIDHDGAQYVD